MPKASKPHLTATSFFQFAKCPAWVWHENFSDPKKKTQVNALAEHLWREGLLHEKEMLAVQKRHKAVAEVPENGDLEDRFLQTLKLMKEGAPVIYHGVLMDKNWVGIPDLLEKVPGESKLGEWYYVPADIKRSLKVDDVYRLQICFYGELLKKIQGVKPQYGYIINGEAKTEEVTLAAFAERFKWTLADIEKIMDGEKPAPHLFGSCKQSPWFKECIADCESQDHIGLIFKIRREETAALVKQGITTITQLSQIDPATAKRKIDIREERLERLKQQATALKEKRIIMVEKPGLITPRTEIYFDIESDPLRDVHYLFGVLVKQRGKKAVYKKFIAKKPEEEGKAWKQFQSFIGRFSNFVIYHYGWFEHQVIRDLTYRHGITKAAARRLRENEGMVDIMPIVARTCLFPVYFYSLKDLAKFLGFKWRATDASGANSITWYHDWLKTKNKKVLQKIVDYNEDDVLATRVLVEWMKKGE